MTEFILLAAANARFEVAALGVSFIALALIVSSYLFKDRVWFLLFQALGIVFLILSYFFTGEYFAMVGLTIGLGRTFVYFLYERKQKLAPVPVAATFCMLTLAAYGVVNLWILGDPKLVDIVNLVVLCLYAVLFRIKNVKLMRYLLLVPTALAVLYNVLCGATVFVIASYSFEIAANVYAIVKFNILSEKKKA